MGMTCKNLLLEGNVENTGKAITQVQANTGKVISQVQHTSAHVQRNARKNRKANKRVNVSHTVITSKPDATGTILCKENKIATTVPSQTLSLEQSEEERSVNNDISNNEHEQQIVSPTRYLSPAHSGVLTAAPVEEYGSKAITQPSPLIPTSQLEVICKEAANFMRDSGKLLTGDAMETELYRKPQQFEQLLDNSDKSARPSSQSSSIGQQVPNYRTYTLEQLELMSVRDIYSMQEQQATPPMERPPQQPKRVQPARSSKSNSTRGK